MNEEKSDNINRRYTKTEEFQSSSLIDKSRKILLEDGITTLISDSISLGYKTIWPFLPEGDGLVFNGVKVGNEKITDKHLPKFITRRVPTSESDYEGQYISCIRKHVTNGEKIVSIGGGKGVSTVVALNSAGKEEEITVFEGSKTEVKNINKTLDINGLSDSANIIHGIVGTKGSIRGNVGNAKKINITQLPDCNVLLLDCDGAEIEILENIEQTPEKMIVEHHAVYENGELKFDYRPSQVEKIITDMGYKVVDKLHDGDRADGHDEIIFVAKQTN